MRETEYEPNIQKNLSFVTNSAGCLKIISPAIPVIKLWLALLLCCGNFFLYNLKKSRTHGGVTLPTLPFSLSWLLLLGNTVRSERVTMQICGEYFHSSTALSRGVHYKARLLG